ncbi:MFS transporter [Deinococcus koreensis]|uniref:MFS transporter n=1 Tax=Deinococcus koreensis TaxID=2054903 RepID=A0A2K3USM8_9DEIO|nr:MFS transporter [Deinococcus koreensis]PNY79539.1 hypothetical protein CVO96_19120 [Deinococcus koreensis]
MTPSLRPHERALYGVGDFGASLCNVAVNTWLLYYLINVAQLPPLQAGLAFLAGRLFDALIDPLIGAWSDRLRPRVGRLAFVRWAALPASLLFALLWALPLVPGAGFALACLGFMAASALYALVTVPYSALNAELTRDYDERTALTSVRVAFSMLGTLVAVAAPPALVLGLSGAEDLAATPAGSWLVVAGGFGALMLVTFLLTGFAVREDFAAPAAHSSARNPADQHRLSVQAVRDVFLTAGFRTLLGVFLMTALGFMITNSLLPFFMESVLRLPGAAQGPLLGLLFVSAILAFPVWVRVSARTGKRVCVLVGLSFIIAALLAYVSVVPGGGVSPALLLTLVLNGAGLSAVTLFPWAMLPDVIEFDEVGSGLRRPGLFYALVLLVLKAAGSLGVFSNAALTSVLGYVQGSAVQSEGTVRGLALMMGPVSAGCFALALLCAWRYPITRERHAEVRARLGKLRDAAAEPAHASPDDRAAPPGQRGVPVP